MNKPIRAALILGSMIVWAACGLALAVYAPTRLPAGVDGFDSIPTGLFCGAALGGGFAWLVTRIFANKVWWEARWRPAIAFSYCLAVPLAFSLALGEALEHSSKQLPAEA